MSNTPIRRHRRASVQVVVRGQRQFRVGLCVSAVLLMVVGFALQQSMGTPARSAEGTSTVAAQPDVLDRRPTASGVPPSAAASDAAGAAGADRKAGVARPTVTGTNGLAAAGRLSAGQGGATSGSAGSG
ncbi:hypothetical protein ND747_21300, partial [Frankia sp. R82]